MKLLMNIVEKSEQELAIETTKNRIYDENMDATVGASEVACPRKSCYSILFPVVHDLERHIILKRGHIAETIFIDALKHYGIPVETQVPYYGEKGTLFAHMKVHPDVVVSIKDIKETGVDEIDSDVEKMRRAGKKIWLNEIKSAAAIPNEFHHYWHLQVMLQAGLIALEKGITEEEIQIELTVVNLNNGKTRTFEFDWDEDIFQEALEVSLIVQQFKEETIEMMMGERSEYSVPVDEVPATYNAAICSLCEYSERCSIFSKKETFKIGSELESEMLSFLDEKDRFNDAKRSFDENIRPIFEKLGVSGVGENIEGKFTPGKEVPVLNISDIPKEEVAKLAESYPDIVLIDTNKLKYQDEVAYAALAKRYGTTKMTKQRLVIKRRKHKKFR